MGQRAECRGTSGSHSSPLLALPLHHSDCTGPPKHPWAAPQGSSSPLTETPSNPHACFICLGERNSPSQLGHLHLQGCQAPEDCSSPENIFPDIFWGCTIYSVVQSHEICRAFHGNHRSSFPLKETANNRKWELYRDKTDPFKDMTETHQNKSCSQECSSVLMGCRTVETVTVLDALWNKAKRAGEAKQKPVQFVPHLSVPLLATPSWACSSSLTDTLGSSFQVPSH